MSLVKIPCVEPDTPDSVVGEVQGPVREEATLHPLHTPQAEPFMRHATTILTMCFN
jgi:hypothetical protein